MDTALLYGCFTVELLIIALISSERALRLTYKDATLSFEELLIVDKSFSIHHRNLQKLATEMYKVINKLSPSFMHTIFPQTTNPYGLRNKNNFKTSNIHSVYYGSEILEFRGPETWSLVPDDIKSSKLYLNFSLKLSARDQLAARADSVVSIYLI